MCGVGNECEWMRREGWRGISPIDVWSFADSASGMVPEGPAKIAQPFKAGSDGPMPPVPKGRLKESGL